MQYLTAFTIVCLATIAYAAVSVEHPACTIEHPVCIIGAGPAGLTAANQLQSQGRKTVIFEKQATVGGKCQAYYENGTFHPLGALLFTNSTYRETLKFINAVDVPAVPFLDGVPKWAFNWKNGSEQAIPAPAATFEVLLAAEIARYVAFWELEFQPSLTSVGYKNGIPDEFVISTAQWLAKHNYQALPVVFIQGMVAYGYGDINQVPIVYMLQYFTPDVLLAFVNVKPGYLIDFHAVFTRFAYKFIKGPIHLNASITNIDRSKSIPTISYTSSFSTGGSHTQKCSALILAFPPTIPALEGAQLDISTDERLVFNPVGTTNYYSGAVRMSGIPSNALFSVESAAPNLPPDADGEPVAFIRFFNTSEIATTWSWGAYRSNQTLEQGRELLKQTLSRINKDPGNPNAISTPVTDADVRAFWKPDYFPHFDSQQLAAGWYAKFNALQGKKNTYYASGLNGFETVEFAVRAGLDVVESYF